MDSFYGEMLTFRVSIKSLRPLSCVQKNIYIYIIQKIVLFGFSSMKIYEEIPNCSHESGRNSKYFSKFKLYVTKYDSSFQ